MKLASKLRVVLSLLFFDSDRKARRELRSRKLLWQRQLQRKRSAASHRPTRHPASFFGLASWNQRIGTREGSTTHNSPLSNAGWSNGIPNSPMKQGGGVGVSGRSAREAAPTSVCHHPPEKPRMDETPSLEAPPAWPNGSELLNHFFPENV
jgi:hypothetical protein